MPGIRVKSALSSCNTCNTRHLSILYLYCIFGQTDLIKLYRRRSYAAIVQDLYCLPFILDTSSNFQVDFMVFAWLLTQLWLITLLPYLIAWRWVDPQTKCRLPSQSVSDGRYLVINICCRTVGLIVFLFVVFLFSGFRSPLSPLLCFITVFLLYVFHYDISQMR